jgi:hypothetical protein
MKIIMIIVSGIIFLLLLFLYIQIRNNPDRNSLTTDRSNSSEKRTKAYKQLSSSSPSSFPTSSSSSFPTSSPSSFPTNSSSSFPTTTSSSFLTSSSSFPTSFHSSFPTTSSSSSFPTSSSSSFSSFNPRKREDVEKEKEIREIINNIKKEKEKGVPSRIDLHGWYLNDCKELMDLLLGKDFHLNAHITFC